VNPAPIIIAWRPDPERYIVYQRDDLNSAGVVLMETADPRAAAELAARELTDWPDGHRPSTDPHDDLEHCECAHRLA
jgi:hypothetical protein